MSIVLFKIIYEKDTEIELVKCFGPLWCKAIAVTFKLENVLSTDPCKKVQNHYILLENQETRRDLMAM